MPILRLRLLHTLGISLFIFHLADASQKIILHDLQPLSKDAPQLTSYAGQPLVLVFWAVWCGPCATELRQLQRLYHTQNTAFVGIAVESPYEQAVAMIQRTGVSFANYHDTSSEFADSLNLSGVPTLLVVDSNGQVVWSQTGYSKFPEDELRQQINKLKQLQRNNYEDKTQ